MSDSGYKIRDQNAIYFITFAVVDWIDVFTRAEYSEHGYRLKIESHLSASPGNTSREDFGFNYDLVVHPRGHASIENTFKLCSVGGT